jgi:1-acyl-sn-glycerol-3-phosphate acyltransferase
MTPRDATLTTRARPGARLPLRLRVARVLVRVLFGALFRIRIEGEPPTTGPYLVAVNHQGWADAFLLLALFPTRPRLAFLGDRDAVTHVWWKRAVLWFFEGLVVRVDRGRRADVAAIDAALRALDAGRALVVFAEGRVSREEGRLGEFHRGIGYLALRARVPILPVWLRGTAELYLGRELVVRVGRPRDPGDAAPTKDATQELARAAHDDVAALASPWVERAPAVKHWRWLTDIL